MTYNQTYNQRAAKLRSKGFHVADIDEAEALKSVDRYIYQQIVIQHKELGITGDDIVNGLESPELLSGYLIGLCTARSAMEKKGKKGKKVKKVKNEVKQNKQ